MSSLCCGAGELDLLIELFFLSILLAASGPVDGALPRTVVDGALEPVDGVLLLGNGGVDAVLGPACGDPRGELTALGLLVAFGRLDFAELERGGICMARMLAKSPSSLQSKPTSIAAWCNDWRTFVQRLFKRPHFLLISSIDVHPRLLVTDWASLGCARNIYRLARGPAAPSIPPSPVGLASTPRSTLSCS